MLLEGVNDPGLVAVRVVDFELLNFLEVEIEWVVHELVVEDTGFPHLVLDYLVLALEQLAPDRLIPEEAVSAVVRGRVVARPREPASVLVHRDPAIVPVK